MSSPAPEESPQTGFQVRLSNFEGPFDLLLQLIFAHRMDVTEVALHRVTDDFIAYTKHIGRQFALDETTAAEGESPLPVSSADRGVDQD